MKYIVTVNGTEIPVDLAGAMARVDGLAFATQLSEAAGPERILRLGHDVHRILVRPGKSGGSYTLWVDGFRLEVEALDERTRAIRDLAAATAKASGPAPLVAPMPGMIVRVRVSEGDVVQAGEGLVVMEAMKMENELRASTPGTVRRVHVAAGTAVEKGAMLLEME